MIEEIEEIITSLEALDITHEDLGVTNGWRDAQGFKKEFEAYIKKILDLIESDGATVQDDYLQEELVKLRNKCKQFKGKVDSVSGIVEKGTNQTNYPAQRKSTTSQLGQVFRQTQKEAYPLENALKVSRLESQLSSGNALRDLQKQSAEELKSLKSKVSDADKLTLSLQDRLGEYGKDKAVSNFTTLAKNHKDQEEVWGVIFVVSSAITGVAILWAFNSLVSSTDLSLVIFDFIKRAFVISLPALFMKVALSKYNLERNLRIIYTHRDTVLDQYSIFESAISNEDKEAKNQFRLEIARAIFSDPNTGYAVSKTGSELNINPVLGTVEKLVKKT